MPAHSFPDFFRICTSQLGLRGYFPTSLQGHGLLVLQEVTSDSHPVWLGLALRELPGEWVAAQETCAELSVSQAWRQRVGQDGLVGGAWALRGEDSGSRAWVPPVTPPPSLTGASVPAPPEVSLVGPQGERSGA